MRSVNQRITLNWDTRLQEILFTLRIQDNFPLSALDVLFPFFCWSHVERSCVEALCSSSHHYFYALLAIYIVLSTNNGLQFINSPIYTDGHALNTEEFLVAEFDGMLRIRVHDTPKRRVFMSTRINYFQNSTTTFQQAKLITKETSCQILVPRMAKFSTEQRLLRKETNQNHQGDKLAF